MVGVAHGRDHFAFNIILAHGAFGAKHFLIIDDAVVVGILREEAANRQRFIAFYTLKACFVEVLVSHSQYFAGTLFLTFCTINFCFT
jgi:hypothetical protein